MSVAIFVLAIVASIPLFLGWFLLGPVLMVSLYLAYRDVAPIADDCLSRPTDGAFSTALSASRPRRVLIVDDNVDSADTLAQIVCGWGHEVAIANDGRSGLRLVTTFQPESALLDIGLPGMTW